MTTYFGNVGHLMQHWTLCELVNIADEHAPGLNFIDAHAMAPWATERHLKSPDPTFESMRRGLSDGQSVYERVWRQLVCEHRGAYPNEGYPNSATFVNRVWTRDFSMLLCEINRQTINALDAWLPSIQSLPKCRRAKVYHGDWRERFARGLPRPVDVGLPDGSLTLVSFDPYKFSSRRRYDDINLGRSRTAGDLYPDDVERTLDALATLQGVPGGIVIQLSTYSTLDGNSQEVVINSLAPIFEGKGFTAAGPVRLDEKMMTLIYYRDISWAAELDDLWKRFKEWFPG